MEPVHDAGRPLDAMCHDIMSWYHAPLRHALPAIRTALAELADGDAPPAVDLMRVAFAALAEMIEAHLAKEEHLLFPALIALAAAERAGRTRPPLPFATILHPIRMMEAEHLKIDSGLEQLREFARDVLGADAADPRWKQCVADLRNLDDDLRDHHRYENQVLFPAALDLERRLL
jgi:regulator of cell morphogenesis and NO signaling